MLIGNALENRFSAQILYDAIVDDTFLAWLAERTARPIKSLLYDLWDEVRVTRRTERPVTADWADGIEEGLRLGKIGMSDDLIDDIAFDFDPDGVRALYVTDDLGDSETITVDALIPSSGGTITTLSQTAPPEGAVPREPEFTVLTIDEPEIITVDADLPPEGSEEGEGTPPETPPAKRKGDMTATYVLGGLAALGVGYGLYKLVTS